MGRSKRPHAVFDEGLKQLFEREVNAHAERLCRLARLAKICGRQECQPRETGPEIQTLSST